MHACIQTDRHRYVYTYIHVYTCTYTHTYIYIEKEGEVGGGGGKDFSKGGRTQEGRIWKGKIHILKCYWSFPIFTDLLLAKLITSLVVLPFTAITGVDKFNICVHCFLCTWNGFELVFMQNYVCIKQSLWVLINII